MFGFWPGVGEVDMQCGHGVGREQVAQEVGCFDPDGAQIGQGQTPAASVDFTDAAEEAFDADEVVAGSQPRGFHQESSVAAAELHLEGLRMVEKGVEVEGSDDGGQVVEHAVRRAGGNGWERRVQLGFGGS